MGKEVTGKTEAETIAQKIRDDIRSGTFRGALAGRAAAEQAPSEDKDGVSFKTFGDRFVERYSKDRGKASWQDDAYMVKQLVAFQSIEGRPLGEKDVQRVTEDDLEAFIKHLVRLGRSSSTRNHYVQLIRAMSKWAVKKGYRSTPMLGADSDVVRRRKEAQRHRRLEPGEEQKLLQSAEPHLQALIVAALETCCRQAELLTLRWGDVSLERGEIVIRAEHAKDRENRIIPISIRLRRVLEARRDSPAGVPFPPSAHVFGNDVGEPVGSVRRAWQTTVLRAHGHKPAWIWKKKAAPNDKGTTRLSPESEAAYRAINLHFHDLRHEGGSRLVESGWPVHHVQHMLGHASLQQTSTYLNATLRGLHASMQQFDRFRPACKPLAKKPARGLRPFRKQAPARSEKSFLH